MRQRKIIYIFISLILMFSISCGRQSDNLPEQDDKTLAEVTSFAEDENVSTDEVDATDDVQDDDAVTEEEGTPYPRLGMWWLDPYTASVEEMSRYDLLLQGFDDDGTLINTLRSIKEVNQNQLNLKPLSPSERQLFIEDWETGESHENPEISHLPSDLFLLQTGTVLTEAIDTTDTVLHVRDMVDEDGNALFHIGGDVAIGTYESAKVILVDTEHNTITVERGYVRAATVHDTNEAVASHIRFWPGSWVMNVTAACKQVQVEGIDKPVNWIQYYCHLIHGDLNNIYRHETDNYDYISGENSYDGFVIDRFEDKESWLKWVNSSEAEDVEINLDLTHTGKSVSAKEFDASWSAGTDMLYEYLHQTYEDAVIIRNNPLTDRFEPYDGQVYETGGWTDPTYEWWKQLIVGKEEEDYYAEMPYLSWFAKDPDALVLFEVYEDEGSPDADSDNDYSNPFEEEDFEPNYQRMRFSLTTALMGNGYYSYEINTDGHGALGLMWFDEYDNAGEGQGYLGQPVSDALELESGIYIRYFENGMALTNPTNKDGKVVLPSTYRAIAGTQVPKVNHGGLVNEIVIPAYDGRILLSAEE